MNRATTSFSILLLCLFVNLHIARAQHKLTGIILEDSTQQHISGATIYIPELGRGTISNMNGTYTLNNLPAGQFNIQYSAPSYSTVVRSVIITEITTTVNVSLAIAYITPVEIVIYGTQSSSYGETPLNISSESQTSMRENGSYNISDGLSRLPGVSQMNYSPGISKPVIRGLSGNRVQTVLLGMRFDNQQWQSEHGLGLSDIGIDKVEVIKGPAALLYGPEAVGGVINVLEEKPAPSNNRKWDVSTRFFTNTYGNATDIGYLSSTDKRQFRLRAGVESHADYSDGNGSRVNNSRYQGYYVKSSLGFNREKFSSVNSYAGSFSRFGFISADNLSKLPHDERWSRNMTGPFHMVFFNVLTSQNTFFLEKSKIKVIGGLSSNLRNENEGGNAISLSMLLNTISINTQWIKSLNKKNEITIGSQDYYQTNKNYGSRIIIPDAHWWNLSAYGYWKYNSRQLFIESGIRYDFAWIKSFPTGSLNTGSGDIAPFTNIYNTLNASAGLSYMFIKKWYLKGNFSSGFRAPNLAELSSNGLHEGTFRWEIGDPDLKLEQSFNNEISIYHEGKRLNLQVAGYYNVFQNYIYLSPTGINYLGFDVYNYLQHDASIAGYEIYADYSPAKLRWLQFIASYTFINGKLSNGENLPMIPANKVNGEVKISFRKKHSYIKTGAWYYQDKYHVGQFETGVPGYVLWYAGAGADFLVKDKNTLTISLVGNNMLNKVYMDYLSMLRYYGYNNMGMNINLNLKYSF